MIQLIKTVMPFDIIEEIITLGEGYKTEFKRTLPVSALTAKSLCAFSNTKGGNLFIGINDCGIPVGVNDISSELKKLEDALLLCIPPSEIIVNSTLFDNKDIIIVEILEGKNKPYYVKNGKNYTAYIRTGDVNLPATKKILKTFINGKYYYHKKALKGNEKIILDIFDQKKRLSLSQIRDMLNYSERRILKILVALTKKGLIVPSNNENNVYYFTAEKKSKMDY